MNPDWVSFQNDPFLLKTFYQLGEINSRNESTSFINCSEYDIFEKWYLLINYHLFPKPFFAGNTGIQACAEIAERISVAKISLIAIAISGFTCVSITGTHFHVNTDWPPFHFGLSESPSESRYQYQSRYACITAHAAKPAMHYYFFYINGQLNGRSINKSSNLDLSWERLLAVVEPVLNVEQLTHLTGSNSIRRR